MAASPSQQVFRIQGMDCAHCAQSVADGVRGLEGVTACELNFATERLRVTGAVPLAAVVARVQELGYRALPEADAAAAAPSSYPSFWAYLLQRGETRLALLGALLILPGLLLNELAGIEHPLIDLCSAAALAAAGLPVARSGWRTLRVNRSVSINLLMTIAAAGALVIGAYTEAGMVMVLFAIGEALEGYTAGRARHAVRSLLEVAPPTAVRLPTSGGTREEQVPVEALAVGDRIRVRPGERIPMDGRVLAGASSVDQSAVTGESNPVDKEIGGEVFAGTINGDGVLEIEVTRAAAENTISRMIRLVQEAQERRAPVQRFVDRFARIYTPAVVMLAALVALLPPLLFDQPFLNPPQGGFGWLYRGLALLVVACPCALVISTPVSLVSALSNAARRGVLVKGGAYLELLSSVRAIAFDKTGTLTAGQPSVVRASAAGCSPAATGSDRCEACDELLALAAAVEGQSEHPFARAVVHEAGRRGLMERYPAATAVTAQRGRGVSGRVDGHQVFVGSHAHFDGVVPHPETACAAADADVEAGRTPLMVSVDGRYLGTITVADGVRPSAAAALAALKEAGVRHLVLLTGDHVTTAQAVAGQVGITDVRAELLPEEKVGAVRRLRAEYGPIAMIGDGINDAPALAAADVGIALSAVSGAATQAMETADITLMGDDLRQVPFVFYLSRATLRTVHANLWISIGVKLLFVLLVLAGLGTMWMAVLADMGTSLLVTLNGMRLLRFRG